LVDKRPVGETPTGATETVALPGTQKLSAKRIGMKTWNLEFGTLNLRWVVVAFALITCNDCPAQIQQAWVARYNNGMLNGTHQAVKMALDSVGNIYILGFSQNTTANLGYVTIKYAPNGTQIWAARFDSTNYPSATPTSFALDSSNNVVVTGNALTVKYDSNGNQVWTAPYTGTGMAVEPGGNVYVTGFGTNFNTVKLNPTGSNVWITTYVDVGPTLSQLVLVDSKGNIYVAGTDTYVYFSLPYGGEGHYDQLAIVKYDSDGKLLWAQGNNAGTGGINSVQVGGAVLDSADDIYLVTAFVDFSAYWTFKYSSSGGVIWSAYPGPTSNSGFGSEDTPHGLALDKGSNVFLAGQIAYSFIGIGGFNYEYGTLKLSSNGTQAWINYFPQPGSGSSEANAIAVDQENNVYVTGFSTGSNLENEMVSIKYDNNGNLIWLQRYASPGGGNAAGNAIAVDNNGNVYVTGYDTTAAGGTEIVTIKYSPVTLRRRSDGTVILQAQGSPGESFDIEASQDLLNWLDLGTFLADTNGLLQFDDTNAPNYPARFYHTTPQ
jgi:hypothetical protein